MSLERSAPGERVEGSAYACQTTDHASRSVLPAITGAILTSPQFGIVTRTDIAVRAPGGVMRTAVVCGHRRFAAKFQSDPYTSNDAALPARRVTVLYGALFGDP